MVFRFIKNSRFEKYLFIAISLVCVLMATFRPFEINKDAPNYAFHAERTCVITECGLTQEVDYDVGYFFLLSIAKVFFEGEQAVLFLAGLAVADRKSVV